MAVATGGKLAERAEQANIPLWKFEHKGQPRAAVGFSFGLLLAAFTRLGLISDPSKELSEAIVAMKKQQEVLKAEIPVNENPAKRLAGQLVEPLGERLCFRLPCTRGTPLEDADQRNRQGRGGI